MDHVIDIIIHIIKQPCPIPVDEFALPRPITDGRVQDASLEVRKKKESYDVFLDWR